MNVTGAIWENESATIPVKAVIFFIQLCCLGQNRKEGVLLRAAVEFLLVDSMKRHSSYTDSFIGVCQITTSWINWFKVSELFCAIYINVKSTRVSERSPI